jgi:hypothetical protein
MAERRRDTAETQAATGTATQRYNQELDLLQADEAALQALRERLNQGLRLSVEDEGRFVALESAISHSRERLPTLEAAKRQERAAIDVTVLVEAWQPLMEAKQAEYDELAVLARQVWDKVGSIEGIHGEQEALLQALPDDQVRRKMLETFWIDSGTMRQRLANNMFPSMAWTDFFLNPLGYRVGTGSTIAANDPGTTPIPPALITNIVEGHLWASRAHQE